MHLWLWVKVTVRYGVCEAPCVTCSPSYTEPHKDSHPLTYLQLVAAVSPFVSRRRSKRVTNCAMVLKDSVRGTSCSRGPSQPSAS